MDWGLAKVLAEGGVADEERASRLHTVEGTQIRTARSSGSGIGTETEAGSLLGTPAYMPPEQANGDVALLDRRADVFGLGAILCEILTGKPPYVGRSADEVRRMAANGVLADAMARLDGCSADQELIVLTKACLAPEAIDRPKDAQAVTDALTAYLDGVQERLHQAELAEAEAKAKAIEEAKRRRLTLALAGTVLLALTLGGGGWLYVKNDREARQAQLARDVNDALNQVNALREKARTAPTGRAALLAQAREQAQRASALVENGPADALLVAQVRQLQADLDEEEQDRKLVTALDEARLAQAASAASESRFAMERAVPVFREAFRAYGLPPGEGEPGAAAERIRQRPAAVREAIIAALDEWDGLAGDPKLRIAEPHREWLQAVLAAAEPEDAWGRQVRAARAEKDDAKRRAALEKLAASADVARVPARALTRLAGRLDPAARVALLRRAQAQYPADFWINHDLGNALQAVTPPQREEAVRFLTAAVSLRPDSPGAHLNLGVTLIYHDQLDEAIACFHQAIALDPKLAAAHTNLGTALVSKGQVEEAIACYHKALELDPKYAWAHNNLGNALAGKGQVEQAIACFKKAIELDPKYALAHNNLGVALKDKGQMDEAIACYRKAIAINPSDGMPHANLGIALKEKGQVDEAIACYRRAIALDPRDVKSLSNLGAALSYQGKVDESIACHRKAIEIDPKYSQAHYNLGLAMETTGRADEAIACFRKVVELEPKFANAHGALGHALLAKGKYAAARDATARALELLPEKHHLRARTSQQLQQCDRLLRLEERLPRLLRGEDKASSTQEGLEIATMCQSKRLYAAAAGFAAAAFAADPKLADDMNAGHRYDATCYAALAAAGQGDDASKLDDRERAHLRKQALDWLRADLAAYLEIYDKGLPTARALIQHQLKHWQQDSDLAGLRDAAALAKLPAEDRAACAKLWTDVAALLKEAEAAVKEDQR
jgi:Tfp pilus assembly protein PilF